MPSPSVRPDPRSFLPLTPLAFQVLLALAGEARHGYGIILDVSERTGGRVRLRTGALYTAIGRLASLGLIRETSRVDDTDARRRFYALTPAGRMALRLETARLEARVEQARSKGVRPVSLKAKS